MQSEAWEEVVWSVVYMGGGGTCKCVSVRACVCSCVGHSRRQMGHTLGWWYPHVGPAVPNLLGTRASFMKDRFSTDQGGGEQFGGGSSTLHLLCT